MINAALLILALLQPAFGLATDAGIADRMDRASAALIGKPYLSDPLGEGANARFDRDPRFREDGFDCTTFVESVVAIAKARSKSEVPGLMDLIRYKHGEISFETRNHFPGIDWIKNNIENGFFQDVTFEVAPDDVAVAEALIEKDEWYGKLNAVRLSGIPESDRAARITELRAFGSKFSKEIESVPYVKRTSLLNKAGLVDRLPHGAIVSLVRPAWDVRKEVGTRLNISHQGLIFHKAGVVMLRHASTVGRVKETPLLTYLLQNTQIAGVHLLIVR